MDMDNLGSPELPKASQVSGDGMVHEVFNGLAGRPDAADALRIPVGHIPGWETMAELVKQGSFNKWLEVVIDIL